MSTPALPPINPRLGLMFAAAHHLLPLFKIGTIDDRLARQMAVSAIESYEPQTRADYVNAARIIAFSMTALALLGKTTNPDMPMPEQMRAYGRANALNRSADQSERTMMQRRRLQKANPSGERPDLIGQNPTPPDPTPPDPTEIADAEIAAAVAGLMKEYQSVASATPIPRAASPAATQRPAAVPLRYSDPTPVAPLPPQSIAGAGPPRTTSYKQELLQTSAMQRAPGQSGAPHPG
jgi:hypothetical protein